MAVDNLHGVASEARPQGLVVTTGLIDTGIPYLTLHDAIANLQEGRSKGTTDLTPERVARLQEHGEKYLEFEFVLGLTSSDDGNSLILRTEHMRPNHNSADVEEARLKLADGLREQKPGISIVRAGTLSFVAMHDIKEHEVLTGNNLTFEAMLELVHIPGYHFLPDVAPESLPVSR